MALKLKKIFAATDLNKGVVIWDTTLRPMCVKLREYDSEAMHYMSIYPKLREGNEFRFTTKSGVAYVIQRLER